MSHNVMIKNVKITSLDALRSAIRELQAEGAKISLDETSGHFRTYRGQPDRCDIAIKLEGAGEPHDIGLVKQPDGSYTPVFDPYGMRGSSGIACEYSPGDDNYDQRRWIGKLMQRYSACVVEQEAALQGHTSQRVPGENGELEVVIEMA